MSLPDDYLTYPNRKYGQDHKRYDWSPAPERTPIFLPNSKKVAVTIIVPLEYFMLNPSSEPYKHAGAMVTPYPDLRHYTTRDYGNRVGAFRLLRAFRDAGVKATFAANAALIERARPLIDALLTDGHELAAYGWDTDTIQWEGMSDEREVDAINRCRTAFDALTTDHKDSSSAHLDEPQPSAVNAHARPDPQRRV